MALGWLWMFTDVTIGNVTMFIAGVAGVVAVNVVLHLKSGRFDRRMIRA